METEASELRRVQPTAEGAAVQKTPAKPSEKKRRRSQMVEDSEGDVPAKIRKTSGSEEREKNAVEKSK